MTIEIRELVIQAKVIAPTESLSPVPTRSIVQKKADEARLVEMISQRVLEKLRENGGWNR
jgi:hypothetical protein